MVDETVSLISNAGVGIAMVVAMFQFAKWLVQKSMKQIEENNAKIFEFLTCTFKDNTRAMNELVTTLKDHVRQKDEALDLLKNRR